MHELQYLYSTAVLNIEIMYESKSRIIVLRYKANLQKLLHDCSKDRSIKKQLPLLFHAPVSHKNQRKH